MYPPRLPGANRRSRRTESDCPWPDPKDRAGRIRNPTWRWAHQQVAALSWRIWSRLRPARSSACRTFGVTS